jgi:superfamily II DNA or RNA helicase
MAEARIRPVTNLTSRGYGLLKSEFTPAELAEIRDTLTVKPKVVPGYGAPGEEVGAFPVYRESSTRLYLPKYYGLQKYGTPEHTNLSAGDAVDVPFVGKLRAEQQGPVSLYLEAAHDPLRRGGILSVGCGFGKTVMSISAWATLGRKGLVIVHKDFLLKQWRERIEQYTPTARIGLIKQKRVDIADKDIVLASLQSLSMRDYPDDVFSSFGMVIIDEVHHCGAEVFSQALMKVNFMYAMGLSATPNRKDGLTSVFTWSLGDIVFQASRPPESVRVQVRTFSSDDPAYCEEQYMYNGKPNVSAMINQVCAHAPRTNWIMDDLIALLEKEPLRRVLLLSDRRQHLVDLETAIKARFPARSVGYYVGGMKEAALKASEGCDFLLGTFAMSSEGMDVPGLDTLILASPKSDVEQSVGRILRLKESDRRYQALIIDIRDDIGIFANQARKRGQFYKKQNYEIKRERERERASPSQPPVPRREIDLSSGGYVL